MDQQKSHPAYTLCEVAQHQSAKSLWIVIKGKVHDVTKLQDDHPGGADVLKDVAGGDGTEAFEYAGHSNEAVRKLDKLAIGVLTNSKISDNFITHTTHLTGGTEIGQPRLAGRLGRHSVTLAVFSMVCTTSLLYLGFNGAKPSSELAEGVTLEMGPEETGMRRCLGTDASGKSNNQITIAYQVVELAFNIRFKKFI
ncbi:hypothetical protein PspLS_12070 [Pyricularia sp. CBS 133598]|nr:hypothetical protein PspLS_12070 [Pyricularia sp. CBS 133598]